MNKIQKNEIIYYQKFNSLYKENNIDFIMNYHAQKWKKLSLVGVMNKINQGYYPNCNFDNNYTKNPKYIKIIYKKKDNNYINVIIDKEIYNYDIIKGKYKVILLSESKYIKDYLYTYVKYNLNKFNLIITHDYDFYKLNPNKIILLPATSTILNYNEYNNYEKTKNCSYICGKYSIKKDSKIKGYYLRYKINKGIMKNKNNIDKYGTYFDNNFINKLTALKDYRFSIAIENSKYDYYFTEKLLDCFLTGTIPIYWGCPSIGKIFDINGILTFDNITELNKILESIDEKLYLSKMNSIKRNFNIAKELSNYDDNLFFNIYHYLNQKKYL